MPDWLAFAATAAAAGDGDVGRGVLVCPRAFEAFAAVLVEWAAEPPAPDAGCTLVFAAAAPGVELQAVVAGLKEAADISTAPGGVFARCILLAYAGRFCQPFNALLSPDLKALVHPDRFDVALFGEFSRPGPGKRSVVTRTALHPSELACLVLKTVQPWQLQPTLPPALRPSAATSAPGSATTRAQSL